MIHSKGIFFAALKSDDDDDDEDDDIDNDNDYDDDDDDDDDDGRIDKIRCYYLALCGILIVCAFLQIVRGTISRKLLRYMRLDIAELSQSLLEEERSRSRRSEENRTSVQNKYDEIRQNFRQKYGGENIRPSITRSDNDDGLLLSSF